MSHEAYLAADMGQDEDSLNKLVELQEKMEKAAKEGPPEDSISMSPVPLVAEEDGVKMGRRHTDPKTEDPKAKHTEAKDAKAADKADHKAESAAAKDFTATGKIETK